MKHAPRSPMLARIESRPHRDDILLETLALLITVWAVLWGLKYLFP